MKRICSILIVLILVVLTSCKTNTPKTPKVLSLELKNTENAKVYQNDLYVPNGVVVYAVYEKQKIDVTKDATFSTINTESIGFKEVIVEYQEVSTSYLVEVVTPPPANTLSLVIRNNPYKTEYYVGEELDPAGLLVVVMKNGQDEAMVDLFSLKFSIRYFGTLVAGFTSIGPYEIVISTEYGETSLSTSLYVNVSQDPAKLPKEMLRVNTAHTKMDYYINETFDSAGLEVYIEDERDITTSIPLEYCTITVTLNGVEKTILDVEGMYSVSVDFRGMKAYYSIQVIYREPVRRLIIDYKEAVIEYKMHEAYTSAGLFIQYVEDDVVKAIVNPANCQIKFLLEGVEHISFDMPGTYQIVIEYEGILESYYVSVI
ncbi:MAG: bacterial Ig-like domain-containing protein [Anaeroplasmataceae bacterium]|nr:bacterial Ig-like domain-containing protein [Anaeroplasmataceae bacterium]